MRSLVKAFGFGVNCSVKTTPYTYYGSDVDGNVTPKTTALFETSVSFDDLNSDESQPFHDAGLFLNATFRNNASESILTTRSCTLRGGIVSYPVIFTNGTVRFQSPSWKNDTFLELQ